MQETATVIASPTTTIVRKFIDYFSTLILFLIGLIEFGDISSEQRYIGFLLRFRVNDAIEERMIDMNLLRLADNNRIIHHLDY